MISNMIFRIPSYVEKFSCSAGSCSDNCCIGWEIDIDESTAEKYKNVKDAFGKRLKENIAFGECTSFILKGERCPFLNESNLCDIIINLGEENLCQICADHPRYFEWYGNIKEGGIGLCCEEAAKLILTAENPLEFTEKEIPFEQGGEFEEELFGLLCEAREKIFSILYNEKKTIRERVGEVLGFSENLQINIDNYINEIPSVEEVKTQGKGDMLSVLESLRELEPIDDNWETCLNSLIENYIETDKNEDFAKYQRNLLIYFIYRYFLKGAFDGEILSKVKLAVTVTAVITYIIKKDNLKENDLEKIVDICKLLSKQVEYSQENLDCMADMFYEKDVYESEMLTGLC